MWDRCGWYMESGTLTLLPDGMSDTQQSHLLWDRMGGRLIVPLIHASLRPYDPQRACPLILVGIRRPWDNLPGEITPTAPVLSLLGRINCDGQQLCVLGRWGQGRTALDWRQECDWNQDWAMTQPYFFFKRLPPNSRSWLDSVFFFVWTVLCFSHSERALSSTKLLQSRVALSLIEGCRSA